MHNLKTFRFYSTNLGREHLPSSSVKIFRKAKAAKTKTTTSKAALERKSSKSNEATNADDHAKTPALEYAENLAKIQMLSKNLHEQLFPAKPRTTPTPTETLNAQKYLNELKRHEIKISSTQKIDDVKLKLPNLKGENIEEHFYNVASEQLKPYKQPLDDLAACALPKLPKNWAKETGWTVYETDTGVGKSIDFPKEKALVFDVEVCVRAGAAPVLATAVGEHFWYSWVSPKLFETAAADDESDQNYTPNDFIPLGRHGAEACKVIVGHNVSYDRARLKEQYLLEDTGVRFLDTMSLHVCVSGITSYQRAMLKSKKEKAPEDLEWAAQSALNSLVDVHRLYCSESGAATPTKEPRNIFFEGTMADVRQNFQMLMNYCASDVVATHQILNKIWPMFLSRFPHPVTLAGMLEMGSAYLPVNQNWLRYINEADLAYEDLSIEAKYHLSRRADEACSLLQDEAYKKHLWLWDEDWSVQQIKMKQLVKKTKRDESKENERRQEFESKLKDLAAAERKLWLQFQYLYDTKQRLPARRPLLTGYPAWYRKLCEKPPPQAADDDEQTWSPGATSISTGMQIAPKLLSLCWEGYPLHYTREHGWGFLVPCRTQHPEDAESTKIPLATLLEQCPVPEFVQKCATENEADYMFDELPKELAAKLGKREFWSRAPKKKQLTEGLYKGAGVWCNELLEGCCYFLKLPHKNGKSLRVGNPLSRDFLNKFAENVLSSGDAACTSAARVIEIARMMSYWRNNRDRIIGQLVVWLNNETLPPELSDAKSTEFGAICPQIVVCGTLTRRAMEPTWMTASNSKQERIGSELRAMVQAPPKYKIVGADVDSQELWIASVLGDAYAYGVHGATPLGWMTLSGTKSNATDMHSVTAKAVGISRDHAKVINYARIYGAGQTFAEGLLKQFNPTFSTTEARGKAMKMFAITKGKRIFKIKPEFQDQYGDKDFSSYEASKIALTSNRPLHEIFYRPKWQGGTESAMFNRLEEIASQDQPVTPFLECRLSRALETGNGSSTAAAENRFLPTRVNWVVQSGAVDFLHLMLVSMRWLMGPHIRFCLSFHDELRYLVKDEFAYKAALAMHVTNLLTRSFCSSRIGLYDLPMSVAFFSSVEVDTALRKESTMDCKTPSNPHGLQLGYGIPAGESLSVYEAIEKAGTNDLTQWNWIK